VNSPNTLIITDNIAEKVPMFATGSKIAPC
jgi:hypothetical protein